jgi:phospholipid/cholesterol/gamma-HCH transport system substrate-binding protein
MLMSVRRDTWGEHLRLQLLGLLLIAIVAGLIGLSVARYLKVFDPGVTVTLRAGEAGLMLPQYGDVRLHGVLVGQIREIEHTGRQAVIEISIDPEQTDVIPANVRAEILPTTLFGQKYVSLTDPANPTAERIAGGDVIPASRVATSTELNRVLGDLFGLLRSFRPADLAYTLNALATALEGRGEQMGRGMEAATAYLTRFNQNLPALRRDIRLFADLTENYRAAMPDLLRLLRNSTVTGHTVVDQRRRLELFLRDMTAVAGVTERFLTENEERMVRLGNVSRPVFELLDTYSPEFPCLLRGMDRYTERLGDTFRNGRIHQFIEFGNDQDPGYTRKDMAVYGERGHGPWCAGLPYPPVPAPPIEFRDGTGIDSQRDSPLPYELQRIFGPQVFRPTSGGGAR